MRYTKRESEQQTTTRLIRAWDRRQPITLTYVKADNTETIRTIEILDITTTKAGNVLIKALDRQSGELRSWRIDRIVAYTVHTGASYQVQPVAVPSSSHGLAAQAPRVATLTPATVTPERRVQQLADLLAA